MIHWWCYVEFGRYFKVLVVTIERVNFPIEEFAQSNVWTIHRRESLVIIELKCQKLIIFDDCNAYLINIRTC